MNQHSAALADVHQLIEELTLKPLKDYTRDELLDRVKYFQERELYFARLLGVSDAGQFRADWDAPILQLIKERDDLKEKMASFLEPVSSAFKKKENVILMRELLARAHPFTEGNPLFKEIKKFLDNEPEPQPIKDALEVALIHLAVWHHRYFEDVDDSEKADLNWILELLGKPKRYQGVPSK